MSDTDLQALWDAIRGLTAKLREGRYWTERRDATEELFKIARQAVWRVCQAARDRDPDVAHWGAHSLNEINRLIASSDDALAEKLEAELAAAGLEPGTTPNEQSSGGTQAQPAASEFGSPEVLLAWLEKFAAGEGGVYAARNFGAMLTLHAEGNRHQTIYVDLRQKDSEGEPIAVFYSYCGEASPEHFLMALQANSTLSGGAFAILQREGRNVLVMLMRSRMADLSESWLRQRLVYLARKADWAEARLKEKDEY